MASPTTSSSSLYQNDQYLYAVDALAAIVQAPVVSTAIQHKPLHSYHQSEALQHYSLYMCVLICSCAMTTCIVLCEDCNTHM
jgi:hypothetical protein